MSDAFIGTTDGVLALRDGALERLGLEGREVSALHAGEDGLLAGTYGDGLFRSADEGRSWEPVTAGLTASTFRFVTDEIAGTEPARLFRSPDGGQSWDEYEAITRIPGHEDWYLPYSPRAGAARNALVCRRPPARRGRGGGAAAQRRRRAHLGLRARGRRRGHPPRHRPPGRSRPALRLARHRIAAAPGGRARRRRPLARRRPDVGEGRDRLHARVARPGRAAGPADRRPRAARRRRAGASSSPPTAATPGSRPATASTCRCPTWSSCSSMRPTARCGRSARAAACCARRPASGRGRSALPAGADVTVKAVAFA